MMRQLHSEVRKLTTTHVWWAMLLGVIAATVVTWLFNHYAATEAILQPPSGEVPEEPGVSSFDDPEIAALTNVYTSGQYLGLLLVMVLGALVVTNEFWHQTATPTFLARPNRFIVIAAKLITAAGVGAVFAVVSMLVAVALGQLTVAEFNLSPGFGDGRVWTSLGLNALAYAIFAVFGLGLGALLRNQVLVVVVVVALRLVGETLLSFVVRALAYAFDKPDLFKIVYAFPGQLASLMTTTTQVEGAPSWYIAAAIMLGYGLLAAGIGGLITHRRDIS